MVCSPHRAGPKPANLRQGLTPTGGTITGGFQNRWEELNRNNNAIYITFFFCSNEGPRYPSILFVLAIITLFLVI